MGAPLAGAAFASLPPLCKFSPPPTSRSHASLVPPLRTSRPQPSPHTISLSLSLLHAAGPGRQGSSSPGQPALPGRPSPAARPFASPSRCRAASAPASCSAPGSERSALGRSGWAPPYTGVPLTLTPRYPVPGGEAEWRSWHCRDPAAPRRQPTVSPQAAPGRCAAVPRGGRLVALGAPPRPVLRGDGRRRDAFRVGRARRWERGHGPDGTVVEAAPGSWQVC